MGVSMAAIGAWAASSAGMTAIATTVGGALLSKALSPKVSSPPGMPAAVPTITANDADTRARDAQKKQREAAAAAVGRSDTILTGQGLGSAGSTGNAAVKTLLGM